jgi:hypothetical protein
MNAHSPIVSEFASDEEQAAYEKWLAAKVAASLGDGGAPVPHDQVMAEVRAIIEKAGKPTQC